MSPKVRNIIKVFLDTIVTVFISGLLILLLLLCLVISEIQIDKELIIRVSFLTVLSWCFLLSISFIHFITRDWDNTIDRELWKTIFLWGFFTRGLSLGIIVYYFKIIRKELLKDASNIQRKQLLYKRITRKFLEVLFYANTILFFPIIIGGLLIVLGFYLRSDILFLCTMKTVAILFILEIVSGVLFDLFMLNHIVNRKWVDDSCKKYFKSLCGLNRYYRESFKKIEEII